MVPSTPCTCSSIFRSPQYLYERPNARLLLNEHGHARCGEHSPINRPAHPLADVVKGFLDEQLMVSRGRETGHGGETRRLDGLFFPGVGGSSSVALPAVLPSSGVTRVLSRAPSGVGVTDLICSAHLSRCRRTLTPRLVCPVFEASYRDCIRHGEGAGPWDVENEVYEERRNLLGSREVGI